MTDHERNQNKEMFCHNLSATEVLTNLHTSTLGLNDEEAKKRILKYGKNKLAEGKKKTFLARFLEQFKNLMVVILLIAAVISGLHKEFADTVIIMAIVLLNAFLGVLQESKAEKALEALKNMSKPFAKVRRNGEVRQIPSEDIVPGDIVLIEAGDYVPADMRLIETFALKIEEAALTGESVPVEKSVEKIDKKDVVLGDRKNMAYMGCSVTYGRGAGVVTATGMATEMGKIAGYLAGHKTEETPLQKKLTELSKSLSLVVILVAMVIFTIGMLQGREFADMFLTSVSLAVAAIPEGLPAVVTIVLALGMQKMAQKNAIIRKLPAVETLGCTEIICSDKTGTLTQNKMTVKEIYFNGRLEADSATPAGEGFDECMQIMSLCNDSKVIKGENSEPAFIGDPTETALVSFAYRFGFDKPEMEEKMPRKAEIPFDSDRKLMTTLHEVNGKYRIMTKGAPDILLERCDRILINGRIEPMSAEHAANIRQANGAMAMKALRVLALAFKDETEMPLEISSHYIEKNLVFAGLVGMIDPPREEAKEAVQICKEAGIRPIMITGDHRDTAAAIARELNIAHSNDEIITGVELDQLSEENFADHVEKYSVYARVSPEHKVRIVKAWKSKGKVVAMTGDGVNDAPALKTSDIGVGMGITGTDVAKGVSDMVLTDDNFATIVSAIKEGRRIYENIRRCIQYLLSANMGEVLTLFVATLLTKTSILFPIHILWINLVTDSLPALSLGMEKAARDIMKRKPRKSEASIFSGGLGINILYQGVLQALITLGVYFLGKMLYVKDTTQEAQMLIPTTMAFVTLGMIQLAHAFNVRSKIRSLFDIGFFTNPYLLGAVVVSGLLQVIVVLAPFLNKLFRVSPLTLEQWLIVLFASVIIIPIVEGVKLVQRKLNMRSERCGK